MARFWRHPLLPVGLCLLALGIGNWLVSRGKVIEYSKRLAASGEVDTGDLTGLTRLDSRTNASLLRRLHRAPASQEMAAAKREFYTLVNNGGRVLAICGFGLLTVGTIRYLGEQRRSRGGHA